MAKLDTSPNSQTKAIACSKAIANLGFTTADLVTKYQNSCFRNSDLDKALGFSDILNGQIEQELEQLIDERCNLTHHKDGRPNIEYGINLMLGWMIEDAVLTRLQANGFDAFLNGTDSNREFLTPKEITQDPDILVNVNSGSRYIEVMGDWKSTWVNSDHLDLRDNKYKNLQQHQVIFYGVSPENDVAVVIDFKSEDHEFVYKAIPQYYGKMGHTLNGVKSLLVSTEESLGRIAKILQ